ncbi:MAG: hypothetical protein H0V00_13725 [Chloroflexia bacterium]|nr:hypothetical protein [Chloroflexia bacterium]
MPARLGVRPQRDSGPQPFSSAWLSGDGPPKPERRPFVLPTWVPDGRALSAGLVVTVCIVVILNGLLSGTRSTAVEQPAIDAAPEAVLTVSSDAPSEPAAITSAAEVAVQITPSTGTMELAAAPAGEVVPLPVEGPVLPKYRVVAYYGHPHDAAMGIVGEHSVEELAAILRQEAENYAAADPSRPVIPAFEVIATVAQRVPGSDGTFILDTDHETLASYIDFAAAQGMLVILDLQIGRGTVANEIEKVRDLLARPNVHLAIDPEFAVAEGQIPGEYIGSVTAESIIYAQQVLAEISAANGIPPKMLIVHQFREDMIQNKDQLAPYPGVQLVIDADGYGGPELKTAVFNFLVRDEPIEFAGVKLFYRQDVPMMTPQEILALVPAPDVIIYQ